MRIVCISDTHSFHRRLEIPEGDVLIHAGDLSARGAPAELMAFDEWLLELPHPHKVFIAGNHDFLFEREPAYARSLVRNATYLQDSGCTLGGLKIWGSPWQPEFFNWAFNLKRGEPLRAKWALIPPDTDILVTHGPPDGILDAVRPVHAGRRVGCEELRVALERLRPRLHVFGHIHEQHGVHRLGETSCVNASSFDERFMHAHPPVVIDL